MQYTQGKTLKINQKIALARWWGIRLDNEKNKKKISRQKNSSGDDDDDDDCCSK